MLRNEVSYTAGRHYRVREAANVPIAPHVPLLIGGSGEKVTLRIVAEHADACSLADSTDPEFYRHKLRILAGHCEAVGRDYMSIRLSATRLWYRAVRASRSAGTASGATPESAQEIRALRWPPEPAGLPGQIRAGPRRAVRPGSATAAHTRIAAPARSCRLRPDR
jgi:alkanesulfonate monooxygenase SsuD/methylene tetrahydromethanopterin reductase-like flavin-dependent oxidoreductase (luciferase family)